MCQEPDAPRWPGACRPCRASRSRPPITVNTTADELTTNGRCSLREAIRNANADSAAQPDCPAGSGADTIVLSAGTYALTIGGSGNNAGDLDLTASVTISRAGAAPTIVDGAGLSGGDRIIDVAEGVTATISGLTIRRAQTTGDGGGVRNAGILTLTDVVVAENTAEDAGGVQNETTGRLTLVRTVIRDN